MKKKRQDSNQEVEAKVNHTFKIKKSLLKECQNCVSFCSGYPLYLNMSRFVEQAMQNHLEHMKKIKVDELKSCNGCFPDPPQTND